MRLELTYIQASNDAAFQFFTSSVNEIIKIYKALRATELFYGFTLIQHNADGSKIISALEN